MKEIDSNPRQFGQQKEEHFSILTYFNCSCSFKQECISFILQKYGLLVGWGKKIRWFIKKNTNIRVKRWKKREKRRNFHCTWGKKYHIEKMGGGILIFLIIYTPDFKLLWKRVFFSFHYMYWFLQNVPYTKINFSLEIWYIHTKLIWWFIKVIKENCWNIESTFPNLTRTLFS